MIKLLLPAILSITLLAGCSSISTFFDSNPTTAIFLIDQAAARYIEKEKDPVLRSDRAQETARVVQIVLDGLQEGETTLTLLEAKLYASFDMSKLEPSDQALIVFIVDDVKTQISDAIDRDRIDENTKIFLSKVLTTILATASTYAIPN